jgi:hypothetical protein
MHAYTRGQKEVELIVKWKNTESEGCVGKHYPAVTAITCAPETGLCVNVYIYL